MTNCDFHSIALNHCPCVHSCISAVNYTLACYELQMKTKWVWALILPDLAFMYILPRADSHGWKLSNHRGGTLRFDRQKTESAVEQQPPVHPLDTVDSLVCVKSYTSKSHMQTVSVSAIGRRWCAHAEPALFHILHASFKQGNDVFTSLEQHLIIGPIYKTPPPKSRLYVRCFRVGIRGPLCCQRGGFLDPACGSGLFKR